MSLLTKTKQTIIEHGLISKGDSVLIALSAGPDSVALLHLLYRLRKTMRLRLHAVYVNHCLRPRAAKREERFCQKLCGQLSIGCTIVTCDVPAVTTTEGGGVEETARRLRYAALEEIAAKHDSDRIALAHHADDRVETILFRLIRGTGSAGLTGMPIKRGKIIRPLFFITKEEILGYLKSYRLTFCQDRSNSDLRFSRNFIRHDLLPLIRRRLNPAVDKALLGLSETARDEEIILDKMARAKAKSILSVTPGGKIQLGLNRFLRYDKWLRRRILRLCYQRVSRLGLAPDREIIERLDILARGTGKSVSLPERVRVVRLENDLVFFRVEKRTFARPVIIGKRLRLEWPSLTFLARESAPGAVMLSERRAETVVIDADKVTLPLEIRTIRAGDRFRPLGAPGRKKIGDYLTDRKLPPLYRDELPVLCDKEGIVWLCGYEIAERVKLTEDTRRTITIERRIRKSRSATTV